MNFLELHALNRVGLVYLIIENRLSRKEEGLS